VTIRFLRSSTRPRSTGRKVEIPQVAIVQCSKIKLVHEHIYRHQASVPVHIDMVAGAEMANKAMERSVPSNPLIANWRGSVGKPI
jgi:hypothetical protein